MSEYRITVPASMVEVGHRVNDSLVVTRADRMAGGGYYIEVSTEYAFGYAKMMEIELREGNVLTYTVEVED